MKLYEYLNLKNYASRSEITNAYTELGYAYRKNKISPEEFDRIHWAFKVLNNQSLRSFYDLFGDRVLSIVLSQTSNILMASYFSWHNILCAKIILIFLLPLAIFSPIFFHYFQSFLFLSLSLLIANALILFMSHKIYASVSTHMQIFYHRRRIFFYNLFLGISFFYLTIFSVGQYYNMKYYLLGIYILLEGSHFYYAMASLNSKRLNCHVHPFTLLFTCIYIVLFTSMRIMLYFYKMNGWSSPTLFLLNCLALMFSGKVSIRLFFFLSFFSLSIYSGWYYYSNIGYSSDLLFICSTVSIVNLVVLLHQFPRIF